jgi:predicted nucleic acid-binding protein
MNRSLLFDANAIYRLIRELPDEKRLEILEGSTITLAYYELGNAVWRECSLLKRISQKEAQDLMYSLYSALQAMDVAPPETQTHENVTFQTALDLSLTFYDAAYLAEAKISKKTLVTDDKQLAKAAKHANVKTLNSTALME